VQLNGDSRVPMDIRRSATHIARHFPTVGDVEGASLLGVLAKDDSLFEHPRNCQGWEENCPGRPLTYNTRLRWPSEDADDGIEGHANQSEGIEIDGEATLEELEEQIESVERARIALRRRTDRLYKTCLKLHPALKAYFMAMAWNEQQAVEWIPGRHFDDGTKTVGHLILEDRHEDIDDQLADLMRQSPVELEARAGASERMHP
jgi:hypothetical protein